MASRIPKPSAGSGSRPQSASKPAKASSRISQPQGERARGSASASKRGSSSSDKRPSSRGR
jgi:hypothetical protein